MNVKRIVQAIILSAFVSACASSNGPYEPIRPESTALQVMKAAGYSGLRDTAPPPHNENATPDGFGKALTWGIGNALAVPPGFNPGTAGALALVSGIFGTRDPDEKVWTSQIVAWMPKNGAQSPADARDKVNLLLWNALSQAIDEIPFPPAYSVEKRTWVNYGGMTERFASLRGGDCGEKRVQCRMDLIVHRMPVEVAAPRILGGFPAYGFASPFQATHIDRRGFGGKVTAIFPDLAVYQRASALLPEWVYLYVAPDKVAYDDDKVGRVLLPYPIVLNQGKFLYFVKP